MRFIWVYTNNACPSVTVINNVTTIAKEVTLIDGVTVEKVKVTDGDGNVTRFDPDSGQMGVMWE